MKRPCIFFSLIFLFFSEPVLAQDINGSLDLMTHWFKANTHRGEVTYIYYPTENRTNNQDRTLVRSAASGWVLNKLAHHQNDATLKFLGRRAIRKELESHYDIKQSILTNKLVVSDKPNARGETVSERYAAQSFLMLAMLALDNGITYEKELKLLQNHLIALANQDGVFPVKKTKRDFWYAPPQTLLALTTIYKKNRDPELKVFLQKSFSAYAKILEKKLEHKRVTFTQITPSWYSQAFTKYFFLTNDSRFKNIVFALNDRLADEALNNIANNTSDEHTAWAASYLESLTTAKIVAKKTGDRERLTRYQDVTAIITKHLLDLQYRHPQAQLFKYPEKVLGGFKSSPDHERIWMDNVWHAANAFMMTSH